VIDSLQFFSSAKIFLMFLPVFLEIYTFKEGFLF